MESPLCAIVSVLLISRTIASVLNEIFIFLNMRIDINVDCGEGFNNEAKIMPFISSCNIACGGHAGDLETINKVVKLAKKNGVRIGAHPSFEDKVNFGRTHLDIEPHELKPLIALQVKHVLAVAKINNAEVAYIKPHGALYHLINHNKTFAVMMLEMMKDQFPGLKLMGLPNSVVSELVSEYGVGFIREGFGDRGYGDDGKLLTRGAKGALLVDVEQIVEQTINLMKSDQVDSICFHGDEPKAVEYIKAVSVSLQEKNIQIGV